jgi:hypothetical protein
MITNSNPSVEKMPKDEKFFQILGRLGSNAVNLARSEGALVKLESQDYLAKVITNVLIKICGSFLLLMGIFFLAMSGVMTMKENLGMSYPVSLLVVGVVLVSIAALFVFLISKEKPKAATVEKTLRKELF